MAIVKAADVESKLADPQADVDVKKLPPEWQTWEAIWQKVRDIYSAVCDVAGKIGFSLPPAPEGSLADILIKPMAGDWDRIAMNGDASKKVCEGMTALAQNMSIIPPQVVPFWKGDAGDQYVMHVEGYALVTWGAGHVVKLLDYVFQALAKGSIKIAEKFIELIVKLVKLIIKLVKKVATRFGGPWAMVASLLKDLGSIIMGDNPIQDIVDDVKFAVELYDNVKTFIEDTKKFIEDCKKCLQAAQGISDELQKLPELGA